MKTILVIVLILLSTIAAAQCEISGPDEIQVGERTTLRATFAAADCDNCLQWSYDGQNALLDGDTKQSEMTVKGALPGTAEIDFAVGGEQKCRRTLRIIAPKTDIVANLKPCAIETDAFTESSNGDGTVTFRAAASSASHRYQWTATYSDGSHKTSSEPQPKFAFTNDKVITSISMKIISGDCTRTVSKSYDPYLWWFLK